MRFRQTFGVAILAALCLLLSANSQAQNRSIGAQNFVMDDGSGHFFTMSAPTGLTGNMTFNFPLPPVGATSGFVTAGTAGGQTLFWNSTVGHNAWEPSSILTNNTNGNGLNITINAPLNMASHLINNVSTPVSATDAANKSYVDAGDATNATAITTETTRAQAAETTNSTNIANEQTRAVAAENTKLSLTGGTMSGVINMGSNKITSVTNPTAGQDAATKSYVDAETTRAQAAETTNSTNIANEQTRAVAAENTKLSLTGGTMSGVINMGSNKITSVTNPTAAQDAATKSYVDNAAAGPGAAVAWGTVDVSTGALTNSYGTINSVSPFVGGVQLNLAVYQTGGTIIANPGAPGATVSFTSFTKSPNPFTLAAADIFGSGLVNFVVYAR